MITAKNITDGQIRALLREAEEQIGTDQDPKWQKQRDAAAEALDRAQVYSAAARSSGRAHCAAILRARAAKGQL